MVRRDWCGLSRAVSEFVLDQILSDNDRDLVVANIHERMERAKEDVLGNRVPLEQFVITKVCVGCCVFISVRRLCQL